MEHVIKFFQVMREAAGGMLPEHADLYFAAGLAFLIVVFFLVRISGGIKALSRGGDKRGEEMVRHFANLEPMFRAAVGNMIELEIGRLKSVLETRIKVMRDAASKNGEEGGGGNGEESEEAKTAAARAEEHRIAIEERMDNIAELVKQRPEQAEAAREQLDKLSEYLRGEFAALAAKLENRPQTADSGNAAAAATPDAAVREQLDKLSLYLHDEFAAVAAKLDGQKPAQTSGGGESGGELEKLSIAMHEKFAAMSAKLEAMPAGDSAALLGMLNDSMNRLSAEVDAKLTLLNGKLEKNMESKMSDALASMNSLREQIDSLAGAGEQMKSINQNMTSLSRLMLARSGADEHGARQQLSELLTQILSAEHFMLDVDLPNGHCAAAMVRFPDPKDSVAIDAGLSLAAFIESIDETAPAAERDAKRQAFRQELVSHINHVADNLISPPHTGESALLFVSSEAAFAEIHVRHRAAVKLALSRRVWLVSPTTLLAVVNTANTAIRDHEARIQLQQMQESVAQIVEEARHFENRLTEIGDHVNSAWRSVQRAENASGRLIGSIRNISGREKIGGAYPPVADDS